MATSNFPSFSPAGTVVVSTTGALSGDGSSGSKLAVQVDGSTISINGSNQLVGAASVASPTKSVQFNNGGLPGGSANLIYDTTTYATPFLQQLTSAHIIGADGAAFGSAPDQGWGFYVGADTYACGAAGGCAPVQFRHIFPTGAGQFVESQAEFDDAMGGTFSYSPFVFFTRLAGGGTWGASGNPIAGLAGVGIAKDAATHVATLTGVWGYVEDFGDAGLTIDLATAFYAGEASAFLTSPTTYAAYWAQSTSGITATNKYNFWADEQGVFRIRADGTFDSVVQAIPALYNPKITKYTPGATNFERIILAQWSNNVAQITTEKGGTGTLRGMTIGASASVPVSVYGVAPVAQPVFATGAGHTTDQVITILQNFGICRQS